MCFVVCSSVFAAEDEKSIGLDEISSKMTNKSSDDAFDLYDDAVLTLNKELENTTKLYFEKQGKPLNPQQIKSLVMDSHRWTNDFLEVKQVMFPSSPVKVIVLEGNSLPTQSDGLKPSMRIRKSGFGTGMVDINSDTEIRGLDILKDNEEKETLSQTDFNNPDHGIQVCSIVVGTVNTYNKENPQIINLPYISHLENADCEYFDDEIKLNPDTFGEYKERRSGSDDTKMFQAIAKNAKEKNIISMSYALDQEALESLLIRKESPNILGVEGEDTPKDKALKTIHKKDNQDKFILLSALQNVNKEKRIANPQTLGKAAKDMPNVFFVSAVKYDGQNYKNLQENLNTLDFFSVVANYEYIASSTEEQMVTQNVYTSYATPILAVVINNIFALSPDLTIPQVKDILKLTALQHSIGTGYIVNPRKAYEFAVGSLLANAQRQYYAGCLDAKVTANISKSPIKWTIACKKTKIQPKDISSLSGKSSDSDKTVDFPYRKENNSSWVNFFKGSVVNTKAVGKINHNYTGHSPIAPDNIKLEIVDINYADNRIDVNFKKGINSESALTNKLSIIQYPKKQKPSLLIENVAESVVKNRIRR
jgi:hypothetical protein